VIVNLFTEDTRFTCRRLERRVERHTIGGRRASHVEYSLIIGMAETLVPGFKSGQLGSQSECTMLNSGIGEGEAIQPALSSDYTSRDDSTLRVGYPAF
jgi:hypothetical protein